jgi:hypothetical protein
MIEEFKFLYGVSLVRISQRTMPKEYTSAGNEYKELFKTSGAIQ